MNEYIGAGVMQLHKINQKNNKVNNLQKSYWKPVKIHDKCKGRLPLYGNEEAGHITHIQGCLPF